MTSLYSSSTLEHLALYIMGGKPHSEYRVDGILVYENILAPVELESVLCLVSYTIKFTFPEKKNTYVSLHRMRNQI